MPPTLRSRRNNNADSAPPRVVEVDTDEEVEITRATAQEQERNKAEKSGTAKGGKKAKVYKSDADDEGDDDERFISVLDVIRVLVTLVLLSVGLSYYVTAGESYTWGFEKDRPWWMRYNDVKQFIVRHSFFPSFSFLFILDIS
jgi:hypothetical protein